MSNIEKDEHSGIYTTGHEWDGIKELNNPLPRWWVWTFYATVIWAFGYVIAYPAIPLISSATSGLLGYSSRASLADQVTSARDAQSVFLEQIAANDVDAIIANEELARFARAGGESLFKVNCSQCHGSGAAGSEGYPNLNDDDWIWGGRLADIEKTLLHGIRSTHASTRISDMPKFGVDKLLKDSEISDVAEYVLSLSRRSTDAAAVPRGEKVFAQQCASCHGKDGKGMQQQGGPNLTDGIWLYGGRRADIVESIRTGRGGVMPHWEGRLDPVTIKMLTVYVHSLGGGVK